MENKFEELKAWQKSHQLVLDIYKIIKKFPTEEKFSLVDQIKRSSSSIPTNIVEGNERKTKNEFIQFLYVSKGSCAETKYHLLLAKDLDYISESEYQNLNQQLTEVSKMISGLINYLKNLKS